MEKVLIADASRVTAHLVRNQLLGEGFVCDIAGSREDVDQLMSSNRYFVALSGLSFEGMEDGEMIDYLLSRKVPTIVVTSTMDERTIRVYQNKGIVDYVLKRSENINYLHRLVRRVQRNRKIKVLVVDDAATVRHMIRTILTNQQLQVHEASNGREALRVIEENPDIKLMMTDYNMPEMDGHQLTLAVRDEHPMDRMGIIVLSSAGDSSAPALFLKSGANDFIHKSASYEEILCRVNGNLDFLELLAESRQRAERDFLTGLRNRRAFFDLAESRISLARGEEHSISLAMLDIDHFKNINDNYGHDVGDVVLKEFAGRLEGYVGDKGIVARFGGEEFCCLLTGPRVNGLAILDGFRRAIEAQSIKIGATDIRYTVSIGVTTNMDGTLKDAITRADNNLYAAKNGGRNRVVGDD